MLSYLTILLIRNNYIFKLSTMKTFVNMLTKALDPLNRVIWWHMPTNGSNHCMTSLYQPTTRSRKSSFLCNLSMPSVNYQFSCNQILPLLKSKSIISFFQTDEFTNIKSYHNNRSYNNHLAKHHISFIPNYHDQLR